MDVTMLVVWPLENSDLSDFACVTTQVSKYEMHTQDPSEYAGLFRRMLTRRTQVLGMTAHIRSLRGCNIWQYQAVAWWLTTPVLPGGRCEFGVQVCGPLMF